MNEKMINGEQLIKLMKSYYKEFPKIFGKGRNEEPFMGGMKILIYYTSTFIRDISGGFKGDSIEEWLELSDEEYGEIVENVPECMRRLNDLELETIKN